jgi:hypothetical protein
MAQPALLVSPQMASAPTYDRPAILRWLQGSM